ncbi:hypothetical protein GP486_003008 [Trichoglossum hirsutum]|uniref:Uncharacterized protein n=1 Tax=Trichoglossum hirsutum TaxID=265104 RepID=A0A9P8LDQ8_9PEZI|nr:hypothetical protein GP486_003008 [Trichoglossum hirsutum]
MSLPPPPPPPPPPLVLQPPLVLPEFLDHVLAHVSAPTTLVACSTREAFLHDLVACVADAQDTTGQQQQQQQLLVPTLHLISTSRSVRLVFTPTLHHLRAYLSTFPANAALPATSEPPTLAVLNPIALHRPLPDFSAQGLSRTFAAAVDAAARSHMRLVVAECPVSPSSAQVADGGVGESVWDEQVPLLSGTLRGFGGEEKGWTGRTVMIRRVLERWCVFSTGRNTALI